MTIKVLQWYVFIFEERYATIFFQSMMRIRIQVNSVAPDGAAERCGIRSGDIVYSIDDTNVLNSSFCDVVKLIKSDSYVLVLRRYRTQGNNGTGKILTSDDVRDTESNRTSRSSSTDRVSV